MFDWVLNTLLELALFALQVISFNPFVPSAPFLYPLTPLEYLTVFRCFQWVEKGCTGNKWVNYKSCIIISKARI